MDTPKSTTLLEYLAARRDWNDYASRIPESGREPYSGAESELTQLIHLLSSQGFAHNTIRDPNILRDLAQALKGIEEFKEMINH